MDNINIKNIFINNNSYKKENKDNSSFLCEINTYNLISKNKLIDVVDDNFIINKIKYVQKYENDLVIEVYEEKFKECLLKINDAIDINITDIFVTVSKGHFGCKKYYSTNHEIANILKLFGKYAKGKIIPNFIHEAPKHLINEFLNGYLAADGCKRIQNINESFRLTTVSYNLAFSIQRLYYKLGYIGSLNFSKREGKKQSFPNGKICNVSDVYSFEVYKNKRRCDYSFIEKGYAWITIRNIEIDNVVNTDVYNLSVVNDNSYIVNNIAVHNCYGYQWRTMQNSISGCDLVEFIP
jgi:intein/homing endonuclease